MRRYLRASGLVPAALIVTLSTAAAAGTVLECFRAGADEYLFPPLAEGLKRTLERRETERKKSEIGRPTGKVLAFLSAKGGCGATTLACHLAVELSRLTKHILLADFDVEAGMVSFLMKSKCAYSISDALKNVHRLDSSYWKALVSNGIPGLEVISAPAIMTARQQPGLEEVRVRRTHQWIERDGARWEPLPLGATDAPRALERAS